LYLWTHQRQPTWANASGWPFTYGPARQTEIVDAALRSPRLCGVRAPGVEQFWAQGREVQQRPLYALITRRMHVVASDGVFELRTLRR
jgi:hypothetical protein